MWVLKKTFYGLTGSLLLIASLFAGQADKSKAQISGVETNQWPDFQLVLFLKDVRATPAEQLADWKIDVAWGNQKCEVKEFGFSERMNQLNKVILIVDNSASMQGKFAFVEQAYKIFIDGLPKNSEVSIIRFQRPTGKKTWAAQFIVQTSNSQYYLKKQDIFSSLTQKTYLLDATYEALSYFGGFFESGQKSMVVLSDGNDVGSKVSLKALQKKALDLGIPLYFIDFSNRSNRNKSAGDLSADSHGFYAASADPKALTDIYYKILNQINNRLILDCRFPDSNLAVPPDGNIDVTVTNSEETISLQRSYAASSDRKTALQLKKSLENSDKSVALPSNPTEQWGVYRDDNWFAIGLAGIKNGDQAIVEKAIATLKTSGDIFGNERSQLLGILLAESQDSPGLGEQYANYYRTNHQGIFVDNILWKKALWHADKGNEAEAEKWMYVLLNEYPWSKYCDDALVYLANAKKGQKLYDDAEKMYLDVKLFYNRGDQYGESLLGLSGMYIEQGAPAKAEEFLLSVEPEFTGLPEGGALYQQLALSQYLQRKYLSAVNTIDQFSQRLPESTELPRALLQQASIYMNNLHQNDKARNLLAGLLSDGKVDSSTREEAQEKYNALLAADQGSLSEACSKTPDDPYLLKLMTENSWQPNENLQNNFLNLATENIKAQRYDDALKITQAVAEECPELGVRDQALFMSSDIFESTGNYPDQLKALSAIMDEFPGSPLFIPAKHKLAKCYVNLGNQRDALKTYEQLLQDVDQNDAEFPVVQSEYDTLKQHARVFLSGEISTTSPADMANIKITVYRLPSEDLELRAKPNTDGKYQIDLPLGRQFTLIVSAPGYLPYTSDLDFREVISSQKVEENIALVAIQKGARITLKNVLFNTGSSELRPESIPTLNEMVRLLKANPNMEIEIAGHTDNTGSVDFNEQLSLNRALSVARYLLEHGISLKNISSKGYAATDPIRPNDTEAGRAENRRVEFRVLKSK